MDAVSRLGGILAILNFSFVIAIVNEVLFHRRLNKFVGFEKNKYGVGGGGVRTTPEEIFSYEHFLEISKSGGAVSAHDVTKDITNDGTGVTVSDEIDRQMK